MSRAAAFFFGGSISAGDGVTAGDVAARATSTTGCGGDGDGAGLGAGGACRSRSAWRYASPSRPTIQADPAMYRPNTTTATAYLATTIPPP